MVVCAACRQQNPDGFAFCGACGARLAETAAPREERKIVTVLFADLVGFTARAERMDPEDVRAMLSPYHSRVRAELERHGGTVEKFIGDAVMALFGAPVAHEDDPERAVRAALAIRGWVREQEEELQLRIAVNTGEALVTLDARPDAGEGMASGDVVNTTARLQSAAPVNGILVGETTYRATRDVIDYREAEFVAAKGKADPIAVWEAIDARSRFGGETEQRGAAPLVGREGELADLIAALARACRDRQAQLVTLVGVPGIGKSRLVYELMQHILDDPDPGLVYWRQGRCLPYGEGVTFSALAEMIKAHAGILESDEPRVAEDKLQDAVASALGDDPSSQWVRDRMLPLIGMAGSAGASAEKRDETFAAWRRFLEALAERRPLVLVFEDLQWADDALLDFVDHLVDWAGDVPLLVVCTARPEFLERRRAWGGGKPNAATVRVSPLSDDDTTRLLLAVLQRHLVDGHLQQELLARAGGNPLYAEQFARMLDERERFDGTLPETVQGIIAARLDALTPEEKSLLQDGAVFGKVFWLGAAAALGGSGHRGVLEERAHALERKEFLRRERRSSVEDETEYAFRHVLVRDVAYGQIPRSGRAAKHAAAATWIEGLGRPDEHAEMLAHHYTTAFELAGSVGEPTEGLAHHARKALEAAGNRALALNAYPAAARFYEQALTLSPRDGPDYARLQVDWGRTKYLAGQDGEPALAAGAAALRAAGDLETAAEAETTLFEVWTRKGERELGETHLATAWKLLAAAPPSRAKATVLMNMALSDMLASRNADALATARRALELAELLSLPAIKAAALDITGVCRAGLGDRGGIDDIKQAAAIAADANAPYEVARAYNNLASVYGVLGDIAAAREAHAECIRVSEEYGQHVWRRWQRPAEALFAYADGDWRRCLAIADELLADRSSEYNSGGVLDLRGLIRLARGDTEGALADAERGVELARTARDPQALYAPLLDASYIAASVGRRDRAAELLDEALAFAEGPVLVGVSAESLVRAAWAATLLDSNDEFLATLAGETGSPWLICARAVAAGDLASAADRCRELQCGPEEAYIRLRLAERLAAAGHRVEADLELSAALAFFRKADATRYIREGEALLAAAS